jgi:hypothetical protein
MKPILESEARMKSESIAALAAALSKAQAALKPAPMNATNPFLKNRYADLGAVIEAAKPVLAANGLAVSQLVSGSGNEIAVTTVLMHSSGEYIETTISLPLGDEKGKSQAQVAGSVITYLRRYSLSSIIGIYADEDGDGASAPAQVQHKAEQPKNGGAPMSLEQAEAVTNTEGVRYGDIPTDKLSHMANAIGNAKQHKPEHDTKLAAIQIILKARAEQSA